jgi:hypothetical protein
MNNIIDLSAAKEKRKEEKDDSLQERRREAISKLRHFRGEVPSKNVIRKLKDVSPGEIFWVTGEKEGKAYIVIGKEKQKITIRALDESATLSTGITIYDFNKGVISKEPIFDFKDIAAVEELTLNFRTFFCKECRNNFYLLYGRDIHYLSIFRDKTTVNHNIDIIFETIKNIGNLISIDFSHSDDDEPRAEIWVRTADSKAELLYLFPFDKGLIDL